MYAEYIRCIHDIIKAIYVYEYININLIHLSGRIKADIENIEV